MLGRVLAAVGGAAERVVVGPPDLAGLLPDGVLLLQEEPPGGGPVAALAAGLLPVTGAGAVAVLAADLPLLTPAAVAHLEAALESGVDGAVYVDEAGRRQWLCGVWRLPVLRGRLVDLATAGPLAGRSLRELLGPLRVAEVAAPPGQPPPWYDCDTPAALAEAERLDGGAR
jgi:molybdopterin-guanine dinucleotide biosynthesis protein A